MHTFLQGNPTLNAIAASSLMVALMLASYFLFEPLITHGQVTDDFTVTQTITGELAFKTAPNDVVMTPNIAGITGGNSFGTSTIAINTNNPTGYNVTIDFEDVIALGGDNVASDIQNYTPSSSGIPDYDFAVDVGDAEFAYTVNGETTAADVDDKFNNNGTDTCSTGSTPTGQGHCWYGTADATGAETILDRSTATPGTGATSTIVFQVGIAANPSPAIETGTYTATATLTALINS